MGEAGWAVDQFLLFTLVLIRMSGLVFFCPFFDEAGHPVQLKIGVSGLLALLVMGFAGASAPAGFQPLAWGLGGYLWAAIQEFGVGFLVGLVANLVLQGVQLAGQHIGRDMGLDMANIVDPERDLEISVISQVKMLLFLAVLVGINGHHVFVEAVARSYEVVPLTGMTISWKVLGLLVNEFGFLWTISLELAAPVIASGLLANLILGIVGRTVPQMNIFIIGFPIRIGLGFGVLLLTIGMMAGVADRLSARSAEKIRAALELSRPSEGVAPPAGTRG
ncbi:MAG TPA: flagellar biosynthetic protein FliR [Planctomycetota bacterium]|nr:flagellar biosynthetic protein FliR [Planctomycetota bacterium]